MSLGDLVISLSANTATLASDMGKANQIMERFAYKSIQSVSQGEAAIKAMSRESSQLVNQLNALGPVADRLQYAFKNLDIKSNFQIDAEKARIIASFEMIKNSGVATFSEIARAKAAAADKMDALDGKVSKGTGSMNLFGLASVAAIAKIQILYSLINTVMSAIGQAPGIAIDAVEKFNSQVVGNAAMITSMQRGLTDVGAAYQKNKVYAQGVQEVLVKMDAETAASAQNLQDMNTQFMQQGILLNANNKKQVEGFKSVANALAAITANDPNKNMQFAQEIRALREMKDVGSNRLVQLLQTQGVTKKVFENWKQIANETKNYGYVLEKLAPYLQGFAAAQGDINAMWETIKSTTVTISDEILRKGFSEAFKEIGGLVSQLNTYLKENADIITGKVIQGLMIAKSLIESVSILLNGPIGGVLKLIASLVLKITEGWNIIAVAVLPEASTKFNNIFKIVTNIWMLGASLGATMLSGLGAVSQALIKIGQGAWKAMRGDVEGAKAELAGVSQTAMAKELDYSLTATKNALKNIKNSAVDIYKGGGRILDRYDAFNAAGNYKSPVMAGSDYYPENVTVGGNKDKKGGAGSVSDYNSFVQMYTTMLDNAEPDEFLRKVEQIDSKFKELNFKYSKLSESEKADFNTKYKSLSILKEETQLRAITEQSDKREKAWIIEMKQFQEAAAKKQKEENQEAHNVAQDAIKIKLDELAIQEKIGEITKPDAEIQRLSLNKQLIDVEMEYLKTLDKSDKKWKETEATIRNLTKNIKELSNNLPLEIVKQDQQRMDILSTNFGGKNPFDSYTNAYRQSTDEISRLKAGSESDRQKADAMTRGMYIDGLRDMTSMASDIMMKGNKEQFEAGKALAISMALVNGGLAVVKALSTLPPPMSFVAAGLTAAMVGVQIASISSQQYQGREFGGPVNAGQTYVVGEKRPELFTPGTSGVITPYVPQGGATVNQNISIDARGADEGVIARIDSAMRQAKEQAKIEILQSMNRGGSFASASGRI